MKVAWYVPVVEQVSVNSLGGSMSKLNKKFRKSIKNNWQKEERKADIVDVGHEKMLVLLRRAVVDV